jgi:DNA repair photolyase
MERKKPPSPRQAYSSNPLRGRGSSINPIGRFERLDVEPDDESRDPEEAPSTPETQYLRDSSRSALASNDSPDIGFNFSLNPYRGCLHGCAYCQVGETAILMADGSARELAALRPGDEIIGTVLHAFYRYRYYRRTRVLAHWEARKRAYRVILEDGTELVASSDHRFLTDRGWKHVAQLAGGSSQRPHLTTNNKLLGFGAVRSTRPSREADEYRRGYLCGIIRGDGHLAVAPKRLSVEKHGQRCRFRLAMIDDEALHRAAAYLLGYGIATRSFVFQRATVRRKEVRAIDANRRDAVLRIQELVSWPSWHHPDWSRGFLAGFFDAEGSFRDGTLRMSNTDESILSRAKDALREMCFTFVQETPKRQSGKTVHYLRVTGGLREHLRFFQSMLPAILRKRNIEGQAVKSNAPLRVVAIEPLGREIPMWDITTGTEDFIANGVISHNCYARPTHEYLGFSPGLDFETKIMVKEDAPELLRQELASRKWEPQTIMMSGVTDCYQPIERRLRITRRCLEVLEEARNPVGIITKNHLVTRDIDLLSSLAEHQAAVVHLSIPTLDPDLARVLEPRASTPRRRLEAIEKLAASGIPVGVMVAPVIPGLTDHEIPKILASAAAAGASTAGWVMLRLPFGVKDIFEAWLREHRPDRAERVLSRVRDTRDGKLYDSEFGTRGRGTGRYADQIETLFRVSRERAGLTGRTDELSATSFRRPEMGPQMPLFPP